MAMHGYVAHQAADAGGDDVLLKDKDEGEEEGEQRVVDELAGALEEAVDDWQRRVDVATQQALQLVAQDWAGIDAVGCRLLRGAGLGGDGCGRKGGSAARVA